ncbi:hypothetical protein, partial [Actinotignum sp. GS-2025b]|uniref:hypothetical protein n=1 Tax=Actinotignum sp. GS-2025b TaxID=3427275 RepID=UPI003F45F3A0
PGSKQRGKAQFGESAPILAQASAAGVHLSRWPGRLPREKTFTERGTKVAPTGRDFSPSRPA